MTILGKLIRRTRQAQQLTTEALADLAEAIPGAPDIPPTAVRYLEVSRRTYCFDDPADPLRWVVMALRIPEEDVMRAMGLARRKEGA